MTKQMFLTLWNHCDIVLSQKGEMHNVHIYFSWVNHQQVFTTFTALATMIHLCGLTLAQPAIGTIEILYT